MIRNAETFRWDRRRTAAVRPSGEEERLLQIAVQRCVRSAAGRRSPRNRFERYVSDRLRTDPTANVSELVQELCHRIRQKE